MDISLSALDAYRLKLDSTAHNIANISTEGYRPFDVSMQEAAGGGVRAYVTRSEDVHGDLSREVADLIITKHAVSANTAVIRQENETLKSIIDILA